MRLLGGGEIDHEVICDLASVERGHFYVRTVQVIIGREFFC